MHHHIEKKEWHYVLEESNYHLLRIFLNDKLVIAQPTYVSEEFKKLGFLDKDEIAADIPAYVRRVKENQLVVEPDELTEDEWSKRTDYYMDFSAYKDGKLAARMERYKLGTRNGSYAGMLYKKVLWNVHSFMYDIRPEPTEIVRVAYNSSSPDGKIEVTFRNGMNELISSDDPRYIEYKKYH